MLISVNGFPHFGSIVFAIRVLGIGHGHYVGLIVLAFQTPNSFVLRFLFLLPISLNFGESILFFTDNVLFS
jgi:hypothetical protein